MDNQTPKSILAFDHTVSLIEGYDQMIASFKKMGEQENSAMIRQELCLRSQYVKDLNEMLSIVNLKVQDVFAKAA